MRFTVELLQPDVVRRLAERNKALQAELNESKQEFRRLETRFGEEAYANGVLVDILNDHGIKYRSYLSHKEREL